MIKAYFYIRMLCLISTAVRGQQCSSIPTVMKNGQNLQYLKNTSVFGLHSILHVL